MIWHEGRELEPGWFCYPNEKDSYCSWRGVCTADGSACVCEDPLHRSPEDRCNVWHPAPTQAPTPPVTNCVPGEKAYCNNNGKCDDLGNACLCYDYQHYWSSERCSTWHEGQELQDGWYCYPDTKDAYCSWKGTCNSDGSACVCDDPEHYWEEERCSTYHSTKSPTPTVTDPCGCHGQGKCADDGVSCECFNYHYYPSEQCSIWHEGKELQDGWYCYPDQKDVYCSYMGTCSSDGSQCLCDDATHRSSNTRCAEWHPAPTLSPTPPSTNCVPNEEAYCNYNGKCNEAGDKCACYDYQHFWPSEQCSTWHEGRELQDGWYCFPGQTKDSYCSYMGTCSQDGTYCICDDPTHRSSDTRCGVWHPAPTSSPTLRPSAVATDKPTKRPTPVVCTPGDRKYCNNRGYCDLTGEFCVVSVYVVELFVW